ncbi:MAG: NAD(P)H-binding protein [Actinomycetota bacterium]
MKITVAGGTGFLGSSIVRSLLDRGHEVTVLGRDPSKVPLLPLLRGADAARGDVTDPESLRGAFDGAEAVVGAVQFPNHPVEVPRKGLTYDLYDRRGTENLLAEARRANVGHYVYISGAGASITSDKTWYRAKGYAEKAVKDSGIPYAILRPSWAYGPGDKALNKIAAIARVSPVVPILGAGVQRVQPVHVDDIAEAVARIFEVGSSWGNTFEIGGAVLTMRQITETLVEVLGKKRAIVPIPLPLAKLGTAPLVLLPAPPMTPLGVEFAAQDGLVDTTATTEVLGVTPVELRTGLKRYLGR